MAQFNGTAGNDTFQNPGGSGSLVLVLSGTSAEGGIFPRVTVLVNGQAVAGATNVEISAVPPATQMLTAPVPAGATSVALHYTNDDQASWASGDRDLYVTSIKLNGVDLPTTTAVYDRTVNGQFHSTIPGQSEMKWSGTLTFSGSTVTNAAAAGSGGANDTFNGQAGIDTLIYSGAHMQYSIGSTSTGVTVSGAGEVDTLIGVERLQFSDHKVALDSAGNAGWAVKIVSSLFGPEFVSNASAIGVGISLLDSGMTPEALVQAAVGTAAFQQLAGGSSNTQFINAVYENVTGRLPDQSVRDNLVGMLDNGSQTKTSIGLFAAGLVGVPDTGILYA